MIAALYMWRDFKFRNFGFDGVWAQETLEPLLLQLNIHRAPFQMPDLPPDFDFSPFEPHDYPKYCWDQEPFDAEIFFLHVLKTAGCSMIADLAKVVNRSNIYSHQAGGKHFSCFKSRNSTIDTTKISSSHHLIISPSHHLIISPSHHLIISSSHHLIISSSHHLTISPSHHLIISPSHHLIISSSHHLIISSSHHLIISSSHHLIISSSHHLTISPSHHLTISPSHHLTISSSHHLIISSSHHLIISSSHHLIIV